MSLEPGSTVGQYEIVGSVGSGGMGVVYRAHDTHLHRTVALKVVSDDRLLPEAADHLLLEARAASALNHPAICTIHEVGHEAGHVFIVMEYVEGRPLHEQIPHDGLPTESVLLYATQLADGLAHAHDHGVVHRDIKSANVIVGKTGRVKIVDFGLARRLVAAPQEQATRTNTSFNTASTVGTLAYMAPEVLQGEHATAASDIWSMGVLLFEMATGHLPFSGRTMFDTTAAILKSPPPPLPEHVPAGIRMIIARCLSKDPEQRYQTARELKAALEAVQSGTAAVPIARPRRRNRSFRPAVVGSAIAVVIAALGVYAWRLARHGGNGAGEGRLVRILSSDRQAQDPALSRDGTMIAYVAEDDAGRIDLFVGRVAGGDRIRLTNDDAREGRPRFSPDGERIVFARRGVDGSDPDICVVPTLGGEVKVILRGGAHPVFSPDASRLAFIRYAPDGKLTLAVASVDGSGIRDVVPSTMQQPFIRAPAWSPDGHLLTFVQGAGGAAGEIWLVDPDKAGSARRVSSDPPAVTSDDPVFSADGRMIIHASNRGGATNIWALPAAGGAATRLTNGGGPDEGPTADGNGRIAFVNARWRNALLVHNLRTNETKSIVRHTPYLWGPAFAPDGRTLAFSRGEIDGAWHVWLTDRDGTAPRQLTSTDGGEVYPRWAPDGKFLIFQSWSTPHRIWRVSREGGPPAPITPAGVDAAYGDVSPDGRTLVYAATIDARERLFVMPIGGGPAREIKSEASLPRWSPDGKWIAFARNRSYFSGIFIMHPDGSGERRVTRTGGWPAWSPDGRTIGYITIRNDSTQQVQLIEVAPRDTAAAPPEPQVVPIRYSWNNFPFDLSPDGESLATTNSVHVSTDIWVLETSQYKR